MEEESEEEEEEPAWIVWDASGRVDHRPSSRPQTLATEDSGEPWFTRD